MQDRKVNAVWIPPEGKDAPKSMCDICKVYRVYYGDVRKCPNCGSEQEIMDKDSGDYPSNKYEVNPMVGIRENPKKKHDADFPPNAQIISDEEVSSVS